jgi:hypothetical protein
MQVNNGDCQYVRDPWLACGSRGLRGAKAKVCQLFCPPPASAAAVARARVEPISFPPSKHVADEPLFCELLHVEG